MVSIKVNASRIIKPKISNDGVLILQDDVPEDVKDWVENG